jgi:fucokinase
MQPLGAAASTEYMGRVDHVASLAGSASPHSSATAADTTPAGRLRRARELVATALRGCPLLVLPLIPSRFLHVAGPGRYFTPRSSFMLTSLNSFDWQEATYITKTDSLHRCSSFFHLSDIL